MSGEPRPRRRGIYLLPNLFTTAGLFAGFYAIVAAMNGRFGAAGVAVFVALLMDGLDGRIARLTNTQSDFGKEYDSLSDMVAFGLAPALVVYQWALVHLGKIGWLGAFLFTSAAALRLARFNVRQATSERRYFQGLASPAAAAVVVGLVWVGDAYGWQPTGALAVVAWTVTVACAWLMVSSIRYRSFKDLDLKGRVPFVAVLAVVLLFVLISVDPPRVLFLLFAGYALSGPVMAVARWRRLHRAASLDRPPEGR